MLYFPPKRGLVLHSRDFFEGGGTQIFILFIYYDRYLKENVQVQKFIFIYMFM